MINCAVWGTQSADYDDSGLLGSDAVSLHERLSWFGRSLDDLHTE